jgi:transposase
MQTATAVTTTSDLLVVQVAALQAELEKERARIEVLTQERDKLRSSYDRLRQELELLRRRIFVAKAERIDSGQLELEFARKLEALDKLAGLIDKPDGPPPASGSQLEGGAGPGGGESPGGGQPPTPKPRGRRDLSQADLPEERVEIADPVFDALVDEGKAQRIGFEESYKLAWQRGGHRRVVIARVKYRVVEKSGDSTIETAPMPDELFTRSLAAPSLLAHIIDEKHCQGMPLNRIEDRFRRDGTPIDRGTMSRWLEDAGSTLGATIIEAARAEALATAFCLSTDATGVAVQPIATGDGKRQPCRKSHFFVQIADRDHVFFEFAPRETSAKVAEMFRGFRGYVQADAKSVYDILYRERPAGDAVGAASEAPCLEVACWSHGRRGFWEAAITLKSAIAREALFRIGRMFMLEAGWRSKPPDEIKRLRNAHLRPVVDDFFAWATIEYEKVRDVRGPLRSAFGYVIRQKTALMRFFDDGRLRLENNASERELRRIAVGRKAWLFVGSNDHGIAAGHLFSLIASARLHGLDSEGYLRDVIRVLPHWPKDRHIELAPKYWAATRARLDAIELAAEVGPLTVPPKVPPSTEQQSSPS